MNRITSLEEFRARKGVAAPTVAEERLIEACISGELCRLENDLPTIATKTNTIRAELLRFLILGGGPDCPVATAGVKLVCAWITGRLIVPMR